jgi:hypothetical protein
MKKIVFNKKPMTCLFALATALPLTVSPTDGLARRSVPSQEARTREDWSALLQKYRPVMGEEAYNLLSRQHAAHAAGTAPVVAAPVIKEIPIVENGEALVDIDATNHPRVKVMEGDMLLKAHSFPEDVDPRGPAHGMARQEVFDALVRTAQELDQIVSEAPEFGYEPGELQVYVFEGLRDLATQKEMFDSKMQRLQKENPTWTEEEAYQATSKWVSPYKNNVPVHSTGAAVDIHLWSDKKQAFCRMGRFNTSGSIAPTFSTDPKLSEQERQNRLLMLIAATRAGLTNYTNEHWHFSLGDRYAAYWRVADPRARVARYGSK